MSVSGFKVLDEIGVIPAGEGSEIRFSIDEFKGHKYGSIRKYLARDSYTGPTRSGITMGKDIIGGVSKVLKKLPVVPQILSEQELGKFAKRPGLFVVCRLTIYRDSTGIDLREWQEDVSYKGWTKKGIRLPYENLKEIIVYLDELYKKMPSED